MTKIICISIKEKRFGKVDLYMSAWTKYILNSLRCKDCTLVLHKLYLFKMVGIGKCSI